MDRKRRFGLRLGTIRRERGISQEQLAERIERTPEAVSNMERGESLPHLDTFIRLAAALGVPLAALIAGLEEDAAPADPHRLQLETRLLDTARRLDLHDLEVAVEQIAVLLHRKRG